MSTAQGPISGFGLLDALAEIGPRPAGSEAAHRAGAEIEEAFQALGAQVMRQPFTFLGYEPEDPSLTVDGTAWHAAACLHANPTPPKGVQGRPRELGLQQVIPGLIAARCFAIEDQDGRDLARLYANPFDGEAISLPAGYGPTLTGPAVWISREDGDRLAASPESLVSLIVKGRFAEGSLDANIIGSLPGTSADKVIVCAHHDSVWNGPGIIDNASGVEAVRRVLASMAGHDHKLTLEGCVFGAEELGLLGSRFYVTEAKLRSELSRVRAVVNIDAIGHGPRLILQATTGPVSSIVEELAIKHELGRFTEVVIGAPGPGSDHYPFTLEGIPSVAVVQFPYPQYHQPLEPAGLLDPEAFEAELAFVAEVTEALLSNTALTSTEGVQERTTPWRRLDSPR